MRLSNRVAVITGAARGLGFAFAKRFAEEGARVVIADRTDCRDRLEAWPPELRERTTWREADVRDYRQVEALMASAAGAARRIDVLVNNASEFADLARRPFHELETEHWERIFATNVTGVFHCVKAVFPYMRRQGYGKIVNVASNAVFKGLPLLLHYVASKGAVWAMTRSLARELGEHRITVNAVAPGYTLHEGTQATDRGRNEQVVKLRCLPRTEIPEDVLGAVLFFASAESDFVTGQTLVVDGGEVFD